MEYLPKKIEMNLKMIETILIIVKNDTLKDVTTSIGNAKKLINVISIFNHPSRTIDSF